MLDFAMSVGGRLKSKFEGRRLERRWERLKARGMHIGQGVNLPMSTWIDMSHCFLISIGDWCGFGEECVLLAHEGQFDEFLDMGRIGRITIHPHSHIGTRSIILAGVEIGPNTVVGAGSLVTRTLPPDTVCAGSPARVLCSLDEYLERHRQTAAERPTFPYQEYDIHALTPAKRAELMAATADGDAYITGGFTATLGGLGGMATTPIQDAPHPWPFRSRSGE